MSLVFAMLAQASQPAAMPPKIEIAPLEEPTESLLIGRYSCAGKTADGKPFEFTLVDAGGRLFKDPKTGKSSLTREEVRIESGAGSSFEGYVFYKGPGRYRGITPDEDAPLGKVITIELLNVDAPHGQLEGQRFAFVQASYWDWMSLANAVGFCDLSVTEQKPLTARETIEYLKQ